MTININSIEIFLSFLCKIFTISVTKFVWIKILKYDYQITYDFYICICTPKHIYVLHANLSIRTRTCHIRKYMSSHILLYVHTPTSICIHKYLPMRMYELDTYMHAPTFVYTCIMYTHKSIYTRVSILTFMWLHERYAY